MRPTWLTFAFAACLSPTEVTVRLTSDACDSIAETQIFLGESQAASATTTACGAQIGSIVMIPASGRDATFTVRVSACDKANAHCIKASRRVSFIPHTELELPIALDRACLDVTCSTDQTCSQGGCVSDDVTNRCVGNTCEPPAPDGGPPGCVPPWFNAPSGPSAIIWHFDDPLPHHDDNMLCAPSMISTAPGMSGCKNAQIETSYEAGASYAFPLGCDASQVAGGLSFHVAFWFRVPPTKYSTLIQHLSAGGFGWSLIVDGTGKLTFQGHTGGTVANLALSGPLDAGSWHAVEAVVSKGALSAAWVDKQSVTVAAVAVGASPNTPILLGPLEGAALDELYIYP